MTEVLTVGLIGCGQAAQAIHLPALASLPKRFRVTLCADADPALAEEVARRCGGVPVSTEQVYGATDVVCIASPHHLHGEHLMAAARAGARAAMVEKPFALDASQARAVAEVASSTNTKIVLDAHHSYDPAWATLRANWGDLPRSAALCRISTLIGPNQVLVEAQTQPEASALRLPPSSEADDMLRRVTDAEPTPQLRLLAGLLLGLATHDLPLVRQSVGLVDTIEHVALFDQGYEIVMRAGRVPVHMTAYLTQLRAFDWSFELIGPEAHMRVEFPPSYLSAVAAKAVRHDASGTHVWPQVHETGYRAAWRDLYRAVVGDEATANGAEGAIADHDLIEAILRFAVA